MSDTVQPLSAPFSLSTYHQLSLTGKNNLHSHFIKLFFDVSSCFVILVIFLYHSMKEDC